MYMDSEQFWKLLEPIHPAANAFSRKLTGNRCDGDDMYQDAVLAALRNFRHLKDECSFRPWFYRILVNTSRNRIRQSLRRLRRERAATATSPLEYDPTDQCGLRLLLARALEVLPAEDRAMVILHEIEGWSIRELVAMYGKPDGTIKNRLFRAKQTLREWIACRSGISSADTAMEVAHALPGFEKADD